MEIAHRGRLYTQTRTTRHLSQTHVCITHTYYAHSYRHTQSEYLSVGVGAAGVAELGDRLVEFLLLLREVLLVEPQQLLALPVLLL